MKRQPSLHGVKRLDLNKIYCQKLAYYLAGDRRVKILSNGKAKNFDTLQDFCSIIPRKRTHKIETLIDAGRKSIQKIHGYIQPYFTPY